MKIVIVGGSAGGATAAARIRRLDEKAQIIVIERSNYISYANCGLPYYIGGVIADRSDLTLQTPDGFWKRYRIDVRTRQEVVAIDCAGKSVAVCNLDDQTIYHESYDKLLLAPGAKPAIPAIFGADCERVFTLRTVEDALRIRAFTDRHRPESAVLAGGGFIGLEMAENLARLGISVTIVQQSRQLLESLDPDMASFVHATARAGGIALRFGETVAGFRAVGNSVQTIMQNGSPVVSGIAILSIGVTPDSHLAKDAGLKLGMRNGIAVNDRMETSQPDIYAVGDAAEIAHFVTGQKTLISLAGPANKQARIAADNICGGNARYAGAQGTSVIKIFEMTAATTGINEKTAQTAGFDYDKIVLFPPSHAGYYPGAQPMAMKVLYEKGSMRLIGAQIVGRDGADKRIDVFAAAIRAGMSASDLTELDLAYAPPYSSAKDPVNIAGYMIENSETGKVRQFHWNEADMLKRDGSLELLDIRTENEYHRGHLEGFYNIPLDNLREHLDKLSLGKPIYIVCQTGLRSYLACRILMQCGFECYHLCGGYKFYQSATRDRLLSQCPFPCGAQP